MNKKYFTFILVALLVASTMISYGADVNDSVLTEILEKVSDYGEGRKDVILYGLETSFEDEEGIDQLKGTLSELMSDKEQGALDKRGITTEEINDSLDSLKDWDKEARMNLLKYVENGQMDKVKELVANDGIEEGNNPPAGGGGGGGALQNPETVPEEPIVSTEEPKEEITEKSPCKFTDIQGHWAKNSIENMANLGFVSGITDETFKPKMEVSRSQMITFIVKLLDIDLQSEGNIPFNDMNPNSWDYDYVRVAYNAKLVSGVSDDQFAPNNVITREQMVMMLMNALDYKKVSVEVNVSEKIEKYNDKYKISSWAVDKMEKAVELGIINGKSENVLDPKGVATRAEAITMLESIYNMIQNK